MAALIVRAMGWDAEDHTTPFSDRNGVDDDLWRNIGTTVLPDAAAAGGLRDEYQQVHMFGSGVLIRSLLEAQVLELSRPRVAAVASSASLPVADARHAPPRMVASPRRTLLPPEWSEDAATPLATAEESAPALSR